MRINGKKRALMIGLCGLFLVVCFASWAGVALAADEGGGGRKVTLRDTLKSAGLIGLVIIGLSVAGVALIITFFIHVRRDELVPPDLLEHVSELFEMIETHQLLTGSTVAESLLEQWPKVTSQFVNIPIHFQYTTVAARKGITVTPRIDEAVLAMSAKPLK